MIEKKKDEMSAWAAARGLHYLGERQLPAETTLLRKGQGIGEHRSTLNATGEGFFSVQKGWTKKRAERSTLNTCEGPLPGGLRGMVGHHVYLSDHGRGNEDGRYQAYVSTVVYAELPQGPRGAYNLELGAVSDIKAGIQVGGRRQTEDPRQAVEPIPTGRLSLGQFEMTTWPAESESRMERIATPEVREALAALPKETRVECEAGRLCAYIQGSPVTDGQRLDALCRLASGIAAGIAEVVAAETPLAPRDRIPEPPESTRGKWLREGAGLVEWPQAPASVIAAQAAYRPVIKKNATRSGWLTYGVGSLAMIFFSLIVAAAWFAGSLFWTSPAVGALGACFIVLGGIRVANREGLKMGQEALDDRIEACAVPWGLEAFSREYAKHSGLAVEDPEELRRRLPGVRSGRAQMAWHGELAPDVTGHLSSWIDPSGPTGQPRFRLVAVVGDEVEERDGIRVERIEGLTVASLDVDSIGRATGRLDDFRGRLAPRPAQVPSE